MTYPHRLSAELRRHKREQFSKWFAYAAAAFTLLYFLGQFAR